MLNYLTSKKTKLQEELNCIEKTVYKDTFANLIYRKELSSQINLINELILYIEINNLDKVKNNRPKIKKFQRNICFGHIKTKNPIKTINYEHLIL